MKEQEVKQLIEKYLAGQCSAQEQAKLETWYINYQEPGLAQLSTAQLKEIHRSYPPGLKEHRGLITLWPRIAIAASILLFITAGIWFIINKNSTPPPIAYQTINKDIVPGSERAILTLANGQKISLSEAKPGKIAAQGGMVIKKTAAGLIVYTTVVQNADGAHRPGMFNTISTPRGGLFGVVLPDGSKVWLNAASSLRYPAEFTGTERRVELHGEAYFEVVKNASMPFKVESDKQLVEDLGTHFDICAYNDDHFYKTTLLEGSVKLNNKVILTPGQQAININNSIGVKVVNTENAIAWKNGKFSFVNENIEDLMRKIARWYNVDVVFDGDMSNKVFSGSVSRFDQISKILTLLESTNTIHFKIDERRITVMP